MKQPLTVIVDGRKMNAKLVGLLSLPHGAQMVYVILATVCLLGIVGVLPIPIPVLLLGIVAVLGVRAFMPSK